MVSEHLIKPWKPPPQQSYIFTNANIVDPVSGTIIPNQTVQISGGIIESVTSTESEYVFIPTSEPIIIDLEGKYLCPGLIDNHVHLAAVPGEKDLTSLYALDQETTLLRQPYVTQQMLRRGFTTVRDCGGATLALKESIASNVIQGPRLFIAGQALSQTGGHGDTHGPHSSSTSSCCGATFTSLARLCDGIPSCLRAAREELRSGADFLKIMAGGGVASPSDRIENKQFTSLEIGAISEVARNAGTYVTAHAYTPSSIRHAIENGATGIEHGNFIDASTAEFMAERDVFLTPTLITYAAMSAPEFEGFLDEDGMRKNESVLAAGLQSLRVAEDAGVTICFGTDLLGPMMSFQSREFGLRGKVLSNESVLRSATVNPARRLGMQNVLGQVKKGFWADLLVLTNNPLRDIGVLDEPEKCVLIVMKEGRIHHSRWGKVEQDVIPKTVVIE